jgi:hypothetical protein
MVIVEPLRNDFNNLFSGSTRADRILKLEVRSSGSAVERFCALEFESSRRRENNAKHLSYATSIISVMDVIRALGLILNYLTDFALYITSADKS